jgi:hypothetical protein
MRKLLIREASLGAQRFADSPEELILGNDVRTFFPELIGVEESLIDILERRRTNFELKGVARSSAPNSPFYIDYISASTAKPSYLKIVLLVLLEDATERMYCSKP